MKRIALISVSIFVITNLLYTQNIIGKLGGTTANETFDITDSGDNLLFRVQGDRGTLFTGTYGTGAIPATGTGTRMMWYPKKAAFRAGIVSGTEWDDDNIGTSSIAMGWDAIASGKYSTAIGGKAKAQSAYSLAVGSNNIGGGNPTSWVETDPIFEIGIGSYTVSNNAVTVLKNGNVGIGTIAPTANIHVRGDDGLLVIGGDYNTGVAQNLGEGSRIHFYSKKRAFRAGYVSGIQWDDANIGYYSVAMGQSTTASDYNSTAMGYNTTASGFNSTAMGFHTTASGDYSTAIGREIEASGDESIAIALNDQNGANVTQANTMAIMGGRVGIGTKSPSEKLVVKTEPNNWGILHTAGTTTVGTWIYDLAGQIGTKSNHRLEFIANNSEPRMTITTSGNVGIGTTTPEVKFHVSHSNSANIVTRFQNTNKGDDARGIDIMIGPDSNPGDGNDFIVFRDGDGTAVGSIYGSGSGGITWGGTSDARLKTNIADLIGGLDMVNNIRARKFEMITAPGIKRIGFIAQELQQVYPQAVSGDPDGDVNEEPMMVDYSSLTPILVQAVKELKQLVFDQQKRIELLESR